MRKTKSETTKHLEQQIEESKKWSKEQNTIVFTQIGNCLKKQFQKQLAKHKDKTEKLIQELEIITSQKQNYGK